MASKKDIPEFKQKVKERSKRYYEKNKDKLNKEKHDNKEKYSRIRRLWYLKNKEHAQKISKEWENKNIEIRKLQNKEWRENNKQHISEYKRKHYQDNKESMLQKAKMKIRFKDKTIRLKENPRTGICYFCNKQNCITHIHHLEYDDKDPLKYTIELCRSCHSKWHRHHPTPQGYINPSKNKQ